MLVLKPFHALKHDCVLKIESKINTHMGSYNIIFPDYDKGHGGTDRSAEDVHSSMAPESTVRVCFAPVL